MKRDALAEIRMTLDKGVAWRKMSRREMSWMNMSRRNVSRRNVSWRNVGRKAVLNVCGRRTGATTATTTAALSVTTAG